jgi:hypothetical protein
VPTLQEEQDAAGFIFLAPSPRLDGGGLFLLINVLLLLSGYRFRQWWQGCRLISVIGMRSHCKTSFPVILNAVKDLNASKIRDSSLRSE